jgi:sugar O-acyltransferase (sialic acid O-acetyltransferase NeuD family)
VTLLKNNKPLIILGNGGHATVLTEVLLLKKSDILGFTSPREEINRFGLHYLGIDEVILDHHPDSVDLVLGTGSINVSSMRKKIFEYYKEKGYTFSTIIHPKAIVSEYSIISEGVQLLAGSIVQAFTTINRNTIINSGVLIEHDCTIGSHVHVAPGTVLSGQVSIGDGTHIGAGSSIIQNIAIGKNVLVGAGSVVIRNIDDHHRVAGVPAKEMG